jgi:heptaprenyl diphosphate synthase
MTTLLGQNAYRDREGSWSGLARIFGPVCRDLEAVEEHLATTLQATPDRAVREIVDFLLESPGKRIRPALVLLSAGTVHGAGNGSRPPQRTAIDVAVAVELIHMASLVHDDLIDAATVRHHRASVQAKWGKRIAVSVGDHLCAKAFRLVADCADPRLFAILGSQLAAMCQGELQQVVSRGDFRLCERHCLAVIEKKTASLFGASCAAGAAAAGGEPPFCQALQTFGFHLGIAFQILDDCRDLLSDQDKLGKPPAQDVSAGDVTLPLLYAIAPRGEGTDRPPAPGRYVVSDRELARIRAAFRSSQAPDRIAELVGSHVGRAGQELRAIADSGFKASLHQLADHIAASVSRTLAG